MNLRCFWNKLSMFLIPYWKIKLISGKGWHRCRVAEFLDASSKKYVRQHNRPKTKQLKFAVDIERPCRRNAQSWSTFVGKIAGMPDFGASDAKQVISLKHGGKDKHDSISVNLERWRGHSHFPWKERSHIKNSWKWLKLIFSGTILRPWGVGPPYLDAPWPQVYISGMMFSFDDSIWK